MNKYIFIVILTILLTGCTNGSELENRDYVMAIGISEDNDYNIDMSVAKLSAGDENGSDTEVIYKGKGSTIDKAIADINNQTKGNLYLGHSKVMIIATDFGDYKNLIDYFSRNIEVSRDMIIVKANNPEKIIEGKNNEDTASKYIYDFFENKNKFDLDKLMDYYNKGEDINLPIVNIENENIIIA